MPETSDPTTLNAAVLQALEQENRVLREQLAAGQPLGTDLRMLRLTEELRQDNLRLAADSQALGSKNIELVFQVEELEEKLRELQSSLEESQQTVFFTRSQFEEARSQAEGERRDLEGRLEETRALNERLRADLESAGRELHQARSLVAQASQELEAARTEAGEQERLVGELRQAEEAARAESTRLAAELEATRARAATLQEGAEEAQRTIEGLEHQLQTVRSGVEDLRAEARGAQQRVEELEARMDSAREVLQARNARVDELERSLSEAGDLAERRGAALEEVTAEGRRLQEALQAAQARATALENTLAQVQEQFVARVEQEHHRPAPERELEGPPHLALSGLVGSLLGAGGSMLVEKVYARCGVDPDSRDPADLERVLTSLEEKASRLLSTAEQRSRLQGVLARVRARLQAGWDAAAGPEAAPAPPEAAEPEATPVPPEQAEPEATPAPPEQAGPEAAPAPPEQAGPEATPAPTGQAEPESVPAPASPGPAPEPEPRAAEPSPVESGAETAPALLLPPREGTPVFEEVRDPAVRARLDEAMDLLAREDFDRSWESLQQLASEHPGLLEVQEGLFHNYTASLCWVEACDIGRRISASALRGPRRARFVPAMHDVLVERLKTVRDLGERKRLFLELAELHLDEPDEARDLLGRALAIHQRTPDDARIDFYMTRLLEGRAEDRLRHVLGALEGVADHLRLFDDLDQVSEDKRHRALRPATGVILALLRRGREAAGAVEKEAGGLLAPAELDPTLVEELHDDEADLVVEFLLNQLLPRAGMQIPFPAPAFQALLEGAQPAPAGCKPAELLDRLNHRLFRIRDLRSHVHPGGRDFWLAASPEPVPEAVLHPELAGLPSPEQQFLVLRTLFQLHHQHLHVWRAAEVLDDESRCRLLGLTRDIVQETGTDVSDSLEREIDSLKPGRPDLARTISELLDRLYYHCLREEFLLLKDFFFSARPFAARLERAADRFGARIVGLTAASYGVARESLGRGPVFQRLEEEGFQALYEPPLEPHRALRLRLQRLWLAPLQEE